MTTYRTIAASETDPDAPLVAALMKAVADNPTAITEGAVGAPRILDAALSQTETTTGRAWVLNRLAMQNVGTVGTCAFLSRTGSTASIVAGSSYAGSTLYYAGILGKSGYSLDNSGVAPSGTWMALGSVASTAETERGTLFVRTV